MTEIAHRTLTGDPRNYDLTSRINHWLVAVAVIGMLASGYYREWIMEPGPAAGQLMGIHKAVGVLVLIYGAWRVGYRLVQGFKPDAAPMPRLQAIAARGVHVLLLVSILAMPLSGLAGSYFGGRAVEVFGLFTIPAGPEIRAVSQAAYGLHGLTAILLVIALAAHIGGALKHHLIDGDSTLNRMLGRA